MHNYLRLLRYTRNHRAALLLIFLLTAAIAGLVALRPWPIKLLIDQVLGGNSLPPFLEEWFDALAIAPSRTLLLAVVVFGGLVLFALHAALETGLTWIWTLVGRRLVYDVFARLQRRSLTFHKRTPVGDLMGRVTTDSWCVYEIANTLIVTPANALLTIVAMIVLMAQLNAQLTLIAIILAPLMVAASLLMGKPLRAAARLKREVESRLQSHIQQTLTGIPVVQAYGQEERESSRFTSFADAAIRTQQQSALFGSFNSLFRRTACRCQEYPFLPVKRGIGVGNTGFFRTGYRVPAHKELPLWNKRVYFFYDLPLYTSYVRNYTTIRNKIEYFLSYVRY